MKKQKYRDRIARLRALIAGPLLLIAVVMSCSDYGDSPLVEIVLPMLTIGDAMATESDTLWFTVRLSALSSVDVTFEYATADSTAIASAGDYDSIQSGLGLIPAGSDSSLIAVVSIHDGNIELPEMFYLILSSPANAVLETAVATGTILDIDGQPRLSILDASAPEGDTLFFILFLSPVSPLDVSFSWRTADSTAIADSGDYAAVLSTTAVIAAGNTLTVISVATGGDEEYEMDESVLILLDSAENAEIVDSVAVGLILNNDFVSYENVVRPILVDTAGCNQAACHNGSVPKGGLNMGDASYVSIMTASGDSEALLIEPSIRMPPCSTRGSSKTQISKECRPIHPVLCFRMKISQRSGTGSTRGRRTTKEERS